MWSKWKAIIDTLFWNACLSGTKRSFSTFFIFLSFYSRYK
jgi:hypothetical protein